jgi:hypothetical protein
MRAADGIQLGYDLWPGPGAAIMSTIYPPLALFEGRTFAIILVAMAWVYPLAAWLRRPVVNSETTDESTVERPALGVRFILVIAAVGVAASAVILIAGRVALHFFSPDRAGAANFALYFFYHVVALGVAIQAVVSGVIVASPRPVGLLRGQAAAA